MKYCISCYNSIPDEYAFCPRCGVHQGNDSEHITSFDKYKNLSIDGVYNNTLELTPQGVHIYGSSCIFHKAYDKMIPYDEVLSIEFTKGSLMTSGFLSIVTHESGLAGWKPPFSMKDTKVISEDQNTIMYNSKQRDEAIKIYEAINEICLHGFNFNKYSDVKEEYGFQDEKNLYSNFEDMTGHDFECFCAELLQGVGFYDVSVTPGSGDQGVDVLASKDGIKYAIQCKKYESKLGNTPVQEVSAGKQFYGCHVGVVMTNSTFTTSAIQLAAATNVLLWDCKKLEEFISQVEATNNFNDHSDYDDNKEYNYEDCEKDNTHLLDKKVIDGSNEQIISDIKVESKKTKRRGLRICSKICFGWSVLCFLMTIMTVVFEKSQDTMEYLGIFLGEGLFTLTLGIMFKILSESEKSNSNLYIYGKKIRKVIFVIICIIVAYVLFLGTLGLCGSLS